LENVKVTISALRSFYLAAQTAGTGRRRPLVCFIFLQNRFIALVLFLASTKRLTLIIYYNKASKSAQSNSMHVSVLHKRVKHADGISKFNLLRE